MNIPDSVNKVASLVVLAGGQSYLVGGAVVDYLQNNQPTDWDLEVYGLQFSRLQKALEGAGFQPKLVGKEFGILKIRGEDGVDIDVSVPRRENRIGVGHKDFAVQLDPDMTPKEAAKRRDLTINSMFYDLEREEVVDPYHGVADLNAGVLRATNPDTFSEDPLRVLRIMQLLPRKGVVVDLDTVELCSSLKDEFWGLSRERVFTEFEKLLLKADRPSVGLEFLRSVDWLEHFPELYALDGCPHNPEWHPEGDAWAHTCIVVDNAATLRPFIPEEWRLAFMLGALLHDVGKPSTTDVDNDCSAKGHDKAGEPIAELFMRRITRDKKLTERVVSLVRCHMQPFFLTQGGAKANAWRRLHNKCRLDVLGFLSLADRAAAMPEVLGDPHDRALTAWKHFFEFGATGEAIPPKVLGRHLIAAGMSPGPEFGPVLKAAYEAQLDDDTLSVEELLEIAGV